MPEKLIFQLNEMYRNRKGWFKVMEIEDDEMVIRYEDSGETQKAKMEDQRRFIAGIEQEEKPLLGIAKDREWFFFLVEKCNRYYRSGHDLSNYRKIIQMHRENHKLAPLLHDPSFIRLIWDTLEAWNMNQQGASLVPPDDLKESIMKWRLDLLSIYKYKLHELKENEIHENVKKPLYKLFVNLNVMASKRRIVGVSKTLHFLLPDLVMPIDGKYTMDYYFSYNKIDKDPQAEFKTFYDILLKNYRIINRLRLTPEDADGKGWNTSIPKLIDNAIIGRYQFALSDEFAKYCENHPK
jgi:hypothetical protein